MQLFKDVRILHSINGGFYMIWITSFCSFVVNAPSYDLIDLHDLCPYGRVKESTFILPMRLIPLFPIIGWLRMTASWGNLCWLQSTAGTWYSSDFQS